MVSGIWCCKDRFEGLVEGGAGEVHVRSLSIAGLQCLVGRLEKGLVAGDTALLICTCVCWMWAHYIAGLGMIRVLHRL